MVLLTMLIIPTLVALGFFLFGGKQVTFKEFLIQNGAQLLLMGCVVMFIKWNNTHDVEVWNGRIESKTHYHVSCEHSYSCHCHEVCSGSGNSRSCYEHCDTCYEHSYDVDWVAKTTNDETVEINRVDRQGLDMPPRWDAIKIGEPTAISHAFVNYIKAAPDSLFRKQGLLEEYKDRIPKYPGDVYDYYHVNRFVDLAGIGEAEQWNKALEELNAKLGKSKQVNVIVVISKNMPEDFYYAMEQSWIGGKKNDFILTINVDDSNKVNWSKVMAWTDNKMAEITVADAVMKMGTVDRAKILQEVDTDVTQYFARKHMKDFEYLSHQTKPSVGEWIFAMIFGLTISIGIGIIYLKNDFS